MKLTRSDYMRVRNHLAIEVGAKGIIQPILQSCLIAGFTAWAAFSGYSATWPTFLVHSYVVITSVMYILAVCVFDKLVREKKLETACHTTIYRESLSFPVRCLIRFAHLSTDAVILASLIHTNSMGYAWCYGFTHLYLVYVHISPNFSKESDKVAQRHLAELPADLTHVSF